MRRLSYIGLFVMILALILAGCAPGEPLPAEVTQTPEEVPAEETPEEVTPAPEETAIPTDEEIVVEVEGNANRFSPDEITVPVNTPVRFVVTSLDMFHTFTVKRDADDAENLFNLEVPVGPAQEIEWVFEETGDYYLYCIPHEAFGMVGIIRVTE